ncbi:transmembrane protease serine 2 [Spea bombifrons]|uniref:transmembrane protease serine 2 n=1 Tax=Spea bombifrons TaxID=233779 RepID=UPI00234A2CE4|nr:transmembrane protease serine 2 [Spea bombifrons]
MYYPNSQNVHPHGPYDNPGFQQDFIYSNIFASAPPPEPQFPAVPHYIPQVSAHHTIPAAQQTKHPVWAGKRKRNILIVTAICVLVVAAIVAAVLAWYFVTNANCDMKCGSSSSCVQSSKWCDGNYDCPSGEDETYCVRLYGPNFELQAYSPVRGRWIPVCSQGWNINFGKATCQELGYSTSSYLTSESTGSVSTGAGSFAVLNTSSPSGSLRTSFSVRDNCPTSRGVSLRCIDCGVRQSSASSSRIVGGVTAQPGNWPWQVGLLSNFRFTCGGSIITSKWIVTAAHCVEGSNANAGVWTVYYGSIYKGQGISSSVERVIAYPGYDTETKHNDIALMKLRSEITFTSTVRPVCLPNDGMIWRAADTCWISGWGAMYEGGSSTEILREASVRLIDRTECNKPSVYNGAITPAMICAGYLTGGIDTCQGDSGGPLVSNTNSLWWLVGDTSWGTGCANRNKPGVYGNVTVFLSWIYHQMQTYR